MAWEFLHMVRREFRGDSHWGEMCMKSADNKKWGWLCYTYELPWKADAAGRSINDHSRIEMGTYELVVRMDGDLRPEGKGWRLELLNTRHRHNVQIHRSARSMFIEGCILPIHFNTFQGSAIKKGDEIIRTQSIALMDKIQSRYVNLSMKSNAAAGRATLTIAETLPAELLTDRSHAHA